MSSNEGPLAGVNPTVAAIPENQIRIEDKLYSTEKLADLHPGGPLFIKVQIHNYMYRVVQLDFTPGI